MANISLCFLLILCTNVYNILAERNVAAGKPTSQSSIAFEGASSRAVDGNTSGDYYGALSCSHTAAETVNWWCVDLEESIDIERVKIYNLKFDLVQFQYRLKAFEIKLSSSGSCDQSGFGFAKSCYKNANTVQDVYTVEECNQGTTSFTGRFVFISVDTNLVMCEVEIFETDRSRTYLQVIYSNTTDYINAVNLSSYKNKNGYILTQTPLPNTVTDFWVLVIQSETNTIIDLSGDVKSRKDIGEYIPREMLVDCDYYTITRNKEKKHHSGLFNVITCRITSKSEEDFDRTVRIYQCNFWKNEQEIPKSANLLFCLLEEINSLSNNTNADPVVVHCLNGVDRGGLFCVLANVLERLTIEQDVGVLQTIMQLRVQRPQIIISYEQFTFCFDAVGEYLDNFSTYANSC